jgi:hypothetical protein
MKQYILEIKSEEITERRMNFTDRKGREQTAVFPEQHGLLYTPDGEVRSCKFNAPRASRDAPATPLKVGQHQVPPCYVDGFGSLKAADPIRHAQLVPASTRKTA